MTYSETIEYLYGLEATRGWDLKLERVHAALDGLGRPDRRYPSVLIAGTNGKGTTAALTHSALSAAGHLAGLYTSPHLVHFTERIRVGLREIDEVRVVEGIARIRRCAPPEETGLTFFEMATLLAFWEFAEADVDVAVLEVGLGGRLDATNVAEPVCSAVTSIGIDHQQWLGETLAEIAREKAGVMRAGRSVVLGPALPEEARSALTDAAAACGARLVPTLGCAPPVAVGLPGRAARNDAAVSLALLDELARGEPHLAVDPEARARGFRDVRWPGRLDVLEVAPRLILDGAHNPESMASLCRELPDIAGGKVRAVFGALSDKPWEALAAELAPHLAEVVVVPVRQRRGVPPEDLARAFASRVPTRIGSGPCAEIERLAHEDDEMPILVTGSLFLLGEVYADRIEKAGCRSVFELPRAGSAA